jgi:hypothetical protein
VSWVREVISSLVKTFRRFSRAAGGAWMLIALEDPTFNLFR